jgi:transcriptional regulator with XRE-family HTH domain
MAEEADVWRALLRARGLTVSELATRLQTTRQHAHRLLTGRRSADARRDDLDRELALGGGEANGRPAYGLAVLGPDAQLDLLPAGDTQPLFADRGLAAETAEILVVEHPDVCVVPVMPGYAWRSLVAFHAAWGSDPEPRQVFLVDDPTEDLPVDEILDELRLGFFETLRLRAAADDPDYLREIERLGERLD